MFHSPSHHGVSQQVFFNLVMECMTTNYKSVSSTESSSAACSALRGVAKESFNQLKLIVMCEIIPEAWLVRVRRLLA